MAIVEIGAVAIGGSILAKRISSVTEKLLGRTISTYIKTISAELEIRQISAVETRKAIESRIQADIQLTKQQTKADLKRIKDNAAEYRDGKIVDTKHRGEEIDNDADQLQERLERSRFVIEMIENHSIEDKIKKIIALSDVLNIAQEEVETSKKETREGTQIPSEDWLMYFREGAERSPDDDTIRRFWARILLGEVQEPGTYSKRTMQTLTMLSPYDAKLFARIGPLIIDGNYIALNERMLPDWFAESEYNGFDKDAIGKFLSDSTVLKRLELSTGQFLHLEAIGLIGGSSGTISTKLGTRVNKHTEEKYFSLLFCRTAHIAVVEPAFQGKVSFPSIVLTEVGRQLLRVADFEPDEEYISDIVNYMRLLKPKKILRQKIDPNIGNGGVVESEIEL